MSDDVSTDRDDGAARVIGLLQVIVGLLVVITIVLLVLLARGPEDRERSGATLPVAAVLTTA